MSALLDQFQERMVNRFQSLNATRKGTGYPIFVLEHGLDEAERNQLRGLLLERLRTETNLARHWLLWAIYATEQGYTYTGHEYWQSFEEATPYWDDRDRSRLKGWFGKFADEYDAVEPTGPWANHFNRIAWPITHAILPKYLQNQFARALWELSYRIANLSSFDARSVGRIFSLYAHGSHRFAEFLEQEELTGRLVLALLGQQARGGVDPIDPVTLQRLVTDLEQVRHGREWLREARRVVQDRIVGIGRGSGPSEPRPNNAGGEPYQPEPSVTPGILLRSKGGGVWTALLDVPDFRPIAVNPSIRDFLRATRVRLAGVEGMRPAGWVMGARRQAALETWPTAGAPLIGFEHPNGVLDNVVANRCAMTKGPTWLFRIGSDGLAREISGRIVRPGGSYILAGHSGLPTAGAWVSEVQIECAGIQARRLAVPAALTQDDIAALRGLQLQVAKTIRVWPAGLPGRSWDGEGSSEWLTTESPCLGLVHDHPIEAYALRLNGGPPTIIEAGVVGYPSFVQLPPLPVGTHHLSARAHRGGFGAATDNAPEAEGYLALKVRDPEPWRPGRSFHTGLVVTTDPVVPDLDAFLENRVDLSVLGPEAHQVRFTLSLRRGDGEDFFSEQVGAALPLPIKSGTWSRHFSAFLAKHGEQFLEASQGRLSIAADELGEFQIPFERNILPIRWVLRQRGDAIFAKVVDDTGQEDREPQILFRSFGSPLAGVMLSAETLRAETEIPAPGGLLSASLESFRDAVVVSAGLTSSGLDGLGVRTSFADLDQPSFDWAQAFNVISNWAEARFAGVLLPLRRDQVIEDFKAAVFHKICGAQWARAEQQFLRRPNEADTLDGLKRLVDRIQSFASLLIRERSRMDGDFNEAAHWFAGRANQYLGVPTALGQDALRFAADPCRVAEQKSDNLNTMMSELIAKPEVLRAARLSALLSANPDGSTGYHSFPRWTW